ncbi:hypothetical protein [Microbulbifer hydrolyticus]|uniref:Cytochrome c maturation protein CcmE n=1 Tax=Microbulbifer hydrolyticus TaxID=48074 RepID=A0A6P1T9V3_9GAMM|nr:hypothetical protein [Microbulbifer hydrolyticus]MBB5213315.1 hypothetical protein [Microbulbifer hydrolyticus]QHQ38601.1 hypothetical protein GTQ55_06105 [Microbulbifer hydrolyticus]
MKTQQLWYYITFSSLAVVLLISAYFLHLERDFVSDHRTFKGYIVNDEELSGFFECGGKIGVSFTDAGKTGIYKEYSARKVKLREPIYVEVVGRITDDGGSGWGMAGEPWDQNLEIFELHRVERLLPVACGARPPIELETTYEG